jgi:hypothetical protein
MTLLSDRATEAPARSVLSARAVFVFVIVLLGSLAIAWSAFDLAHAEFDAQWVLLAALTLLTGVLQLRAPGAGIAMSMAEPLVFVGAFLCGPSLGTLLAFLDALVLMPRFRRLRRPLVAFNLAAGPLAVWGAAHVAGLQPLPAADTPLGVGFLPVLAIFAGAYFIFNSGLIVLATVLDRGGNPVRVWRTYAAGLAPSYAAGACLAALLVLSDRNVSWVLMLAAPLLFAIYRAADVSARLAIAERTLEAERRQRRLEILTEEGLKRLTTPDKNPTARF